MTTNLRFVLPIRTSKRKKEAKSPQQQRDLAYAWARSHGHEIVTVLDSGRDESGKTMDRETIRKAMEMVRVGQADGILFALTDRLGRAPIEESMAWIRQLEVIGYLGLADAGGGPVRLAGGDPSRETALVVQLQMARQYWLASATRFRQSQRDAVRAGKWIGQLPIGYRRENGILRPHETEATAMTDAYRIAAECGLHAAVAHLEAAMPERKWTTARVRRMLASRTYLGENRYVLNEDPGNFPAELLVAPEDKQHEALTDETTWRAAQTVPHTRRSDGEYPLTRRVHCGHCGEGLTGGLQTIIGTDYRYRRMRCANRGCNRSSISADKLERHIHDVMAAKLGEQAFRDRFSPNESAIAAANADLKAAGRERRALPKKVKPSHPDFAEWLAAADADVEEAQERVTRLGGDAAVSRRLPLAHELDDPEKFAEALAAITSIGVITIRPGRGPVEDRTVYRLKRDDVAGALAA